MRAVILAGGEGTRLHPYTTVLPKPLVPVGDRPILEIIIRQLARAGFDRIDLSLGHLGELIRVYFTESRSVPEGVQIAYSWEDQPLGTAGALKLVGPVDEPILVMNGDILTNIDFAALMREHAQRDPALTIATHRKEVPLALGIVEGEDGDVSGYVEKPTLKYEVSMGIYVYAPRALGFIPDGRFDFPDLVLALLAAGERVAKYPSDGRWFDIGTPEEHERALNAFESAPEIFDPGD